MSPPWNEVSALCRLIFSILFLGAWTVRAAPDQFTPGSSHRLTFHDVDGRTLSTSDGHVTILTVVTRADEDKARTVADLVPDRYIGDQKYRYITLVNFERKLLSPVHGLTRAIIRNRLTAEAKELQPQYLAKKITHDPRRDLYVIADFDGSATEQLGLSAEATALAVFVFNGKGELLAHWSEVPPGDALPKILAAAE